jgi:hypothetical protein
MLERRPEPRRDQQAPELYCGRDPTRVRVIIQSRPTDMTAQGVIQKLFS